MVRRERASSRVCVLESAEPRERPVATVELITSVALALSTAIAATAVSIGIARAEVFNLRPDSDPSSLAIGLLIGLLLLGMGGLIATMMDGPKDKASGKA
jgi:hypothetical protein